VSGLLSTFNLFVIIPDVPGIVPDVHEADTFFPDIFLWATQNNTLSIDKILDVIFASPDNPSGIMVPCRL
jgi:hypothetical protein